MEPQEVEALAVLEVHDPGLGWLNAQLEPQGKPLVALDAIGAGTGELVFWCRGKEASFPFKREDTPTDCTIIAIVDSDAHVTNGGRKQ